MAGVKLGAKLEVAVLLHTYRNIDLFQQGLYQIRLTLYHTSASTVRAI